MSRVTAFQTKVYDALSGVPAGRVVSYGVLAAGVGCRSPRAVGQALRCNPFAPRVPCHRVIAADTSPGGFTGERGGAALRRKLALLKSEGVEFADGRLKEPARMLTEL